MQFILSYRWLSINSNDVTVAGLFGEISHGKWMSTVKNEKNIKMIKKSIDIYRRI